MITRLRWLYQIHGIVVSREVMVKAGFKRFEKLPVGSDIALGRLL